MEGKTNGSRDELFDKAHEILVKVYREAKAPIYCGEVLRECLSVGFTRAARIVMQLERSGLVSKPIADTSGRRVNTHPDGPDAVHGAHKVGEPEPPSSIHAGECPVWPGFNRGDFHPGMNYRDFLAVNAMLAILNNPQCPSGWLTGCAPPFVAESAYKIADAMLTAGARPNAPS